MARIAGVNLPAQKHVWVGLQSIYGIGRTRSRQVDAGNTRHGAALQILAAGEDPGMWALW